VESERERNERMLLDVARGKVALSPAAGFLHGGGAIQRPELVALRALARDGLVTMPTADYEGLTVKLRLTPLGMDLVSELVGVEVE